MKPLQVYGLIGNSGAGKSTFADASRIVLENKLGYKVHYYHARQPIVDLLCKTFDVGEEYIEDKKRKNKFMRYLMKMTGDWVNDFDNSSDDHISVLRGMTLARDKASNSGADILIIDGVRLYEQCQQVRKQFLGQLVRVLGGVNEDKHVSDREWKRFAPDLIFDNTDKPRDILDKVLVFWKGAGLWNVYSNLLQIYIQ